MRDLEAAGELFAGNSVDATASETQPVKIGQICTFLNWCELFNCMSDLIRVRTDHKGIKLDS